jgi:hypothetical protein
MELGQGDTHGERIASALIEAVNPVGSELQLVNVADFIAYIHCEQLANIQDIVDSSIELFFKPGTLSFGWVADYEVDWDCKPTIILTMELRCHEIWIVFKLILRAMENSVIIEFLSYDTSSGNPDKDLARLIEAIEDARLPCRGE